MKRYRGEVEILEMLRLYLMFLRDRERQAHADIKRWEEKHKNPAVARWADIPYGESIAYQQARLEFVRYAADIKVALKELVKELRDDGR
jgi:hypothetical protein